MLCKKMDLFGCELIAIDGSKFKAHNSNDRNYTKNKLAKIIKKIDDEIESYLRDLDEGDEKEKEVKEPSSEALKEKINRLRQHKGKYQKLQSQPDSSDEGQISQTDPDSRMMQSRNGKDVCYNVQIVTDNKHKLIVAHAVTNELTDLHCLHEMAHQAKEILGVEKIDAIADAGYFERTNLKKCHDDHIQTFVPKPMRSHNKSQGLYTYQDFVYDRESDTYQCPAGQTLTFRGMKRKGEIAERIYSTHSCYQCPKKLKCTRARSTRRIYRWEYEEVLEQLDQRIKDKPNIINDRKAMVEHPFGTMKNGMGYQHFLTCGIINTSAEMSFSILAYNLKRVLNIVDFKQLMAWVA